MSKPKIIPHKIKSPIQLLALWFSTLVVIEGIFFTAAYNIQSPNWCAPIIIIAAILFVPAFLVVGFVMQTKFRPQLQEDRYYSEWLERQETLFIGFKPENEPIIDSPNKPSIVNETWEKCEKRRVERYQVQEGIFLVHAWRPSSAPRQVADIIIWLHQHKAGPLNRGEVEQVDYHLGPMFFKHTVTKKNKHESFKLEVSAYYPMLCLAKVFLRGRKDPIELERYIDFEVPFNNSSQSKPRITY